MTNKSHRAALACNPNTAINVLAALSEQKNSQLNDRILHNLFSRTIKRTEEQELMQELLSESILPRMRLFNTVPQFGVEDTLLRDYIRTKTDQIKTITTQQEYNKLLKELDTMYTILNSPTTRAVSLTIERLNKTQDPFSFFITQTGKEKAEQVAASMRNVPLELRDKIMSTTMGKEVFNVQKALAQHRNWLHSLFAGEQFNYKRELTQFKPSTAANAFKKLPKEITQQEQSTQTNPKTK
jgi:hypothetical protein